MTGAKKQNINISTTQDYRKLDGINQSMLKKFDEDPMLFFSEFILGNPRVEKESNALTIGSLVDYILLDCGGDEQEFEQKMHEKFGVFDGIKSSAQAFDLADELFKILTRNLDSEGKITADFGDSFKEAFSVVQAKDKYKGKTWEKGLEDFNKTAKEYLDSKIANIGKIVVDLWQIEKAKNLCAQTRGDEFHGALVNMQSGGDTDVYDKLAIEFKCQGWGCKMEQDRTIIDHKNKTIRRIDYKTAYDNEDFEYSYLRRKYYLQNAFYHAGTEMWAIANDMSGYEVLPMEFLVFDTSVNNRRPLKYDTTMEHVEEGLAGFVHNTRKYNGIIDLLEDITWAQNSGVWNISRANYLNNGVVNMKTFMDEL